MTNGHRPVDITPAVGDPGDETGRRYRYQWMYAAILCCMLLDDGSDVTELFCEHHEDVLLKYKDGTFSGLQVKTRASDQPLWKTNDDAVISTFKRFALLEAQFPAQFHDYRFLTNHPLHSAGNGQDPVWSLLQIKEAANLAAVTGPSLRLIEKISKQANCSEEIAFNALAKTQASHDLPGLNDVFSRLVATLSVVWSKAEDASQASCRRAALALISECERASTLGHTDLLPAYLAASREPENMEQAARLQGKRMDQTCVMQALERGLDETIPLLADPADFIEPGEGTTSLLSQKLDAGGFSVVSVNSAQDLRNKADYLGIVWTKKLGREVGLQHYSHVRSLVLHDSAAAYEASSSSEVLFGVEMLSALRSRFNLRRTEGDQLYGCSNEHLEGFAYSLTSQCKVLWSHDRPWEDS